MLAALFGALHSMNLFSRADGPPQHQISVVDIIAIGDCSHVIEYRCVPGVSSVPVICNRQHRQQTHTAHRRYVCIVCATQKAMPTATGAIKNS